jgi:hypothetical protein
MSTLVAKHDNLQRSFLRKYFYSICIIVILIFSQVTEYHFSLSVSLFLLLIIMVLDLLGKGMVLRELIALYSVFICLVMPILGYTIFGFDSIQGKIWGRFMPIAQEEYFGFALPAVGLFTLAICWPIDNSKIGDSGYLMQMAIDRAKKKLQGMPKIGLYITLTGIATMFITFALPSAFQFIGTLLYWSSFAGALYLYYTKEIKYKRAYLLGFTCIIFSSALQNGMFTVVAYMGITIFSYFFLGRKMALGKKVLFFLLSCFFLLLIQNIKHEYRNYIWRKGYQDNKVLLFSELFINRLNNASVIFTKQAYFGIYYRTNQGFNVSLVMKRFPRVVPFDNGKNLQLSILSSFVPRLFWPNKPEAGGKQNMKYYTGIIIKTYSTNVGPLGEAYGSFGVTGGIIYMFLLGAFIRWAYKRVFIAALKIPLLIFWIPVMFYQITYSAESDTLQIFNSLIKSAFFVWILIKILPKWFGIDKPVINRNNKVTPQLNPDPSLN